MLSANSRTRLSALLSSLLFPWLLLAHPMGNFSVSHYTKLHVTSKGVDIRYVLDLAEIPTFELLRTWKLDRFALSRELDERADEQSREWLTHLSFSHNGRSLQPTLIRSKLTISDGAGGLPIARIDMEAHIDDTSGVLHFEDGNFSERAGWKEIVIDAADNAHLLRASSPNREISKALTDYPPDPTLAPPQDLRAEVEWKPVAPIPVASKGDSAHPRPAPKQQPEPAIASIPQPHLAPPASSPPTLTAAQAPAGSVVRGDYLSRILGGKEVTLSVILLALGAAFALGAAHALTPGHGKAIVAAYLVGSKGTLKHAAFLGAMVTFTHTISVFALGLATLFLFRYIVPEKVTAILGVVSGLSIVVIGAWMLRKRFAQSKPSHPHQHGHQHGHGHQYEGGHSHDRGHGQTHTHDHTHRHAHTHGHDHTHSHAHNDPGHGHSHHHGGPGGHTHSHMPEELSWRGLVALGASGGLVPCESALVLLLGAVAVGRVGLGLLLLVSFSLGLALVLTGIGVLVLYAKNLIPENFRSRRFPLLRWISVASPAVVIVVGIVMTAASFGWISPKWTIG